MAFDIRKFLAKFTDEAREHVNKLNEGLISLEKNPDDSETINAIFRSAHTIKGSSRMMKLTPITEVAHKLEDALGALRDKKINHSKELADLLFRGIDTISGMIEKTAAGQEITDDNTALCEKLAKAAEGSPVETERQIKEAEQDETVIARSDRPEAIVEACPERSDRDEIALPLARNDKSEGFRLKTTETVRINAEKLDELIKLMGEIVSNQNRSKQRLQDIKDVERLVKNNLEVIQQLKKENNGGFPDTLLNSAQSLFIQTKQMSASMRDDNNLQELLTDELQEKALMMRMVPLSLIFDTLPRMARDIANPLGKEIDLIIEGGNIELDKKMIEKLGDPLVHMIRNAVDHGIELPAERVKAGKPERGAVRLSACYDAGSVLLELSDDGGGIPLARIREKALKKKMFTEEELNTMPDSAITDLIFHPGLSTSSIITDLSGRGVGMDVVKRNIVEDLRGSVKVETREGRGASFYIRLPMTLAVMRVLLVTVSDMTFAVTANYVREIIRLPETGFMNVVDKRAIRLRNEFVPVVRLDALLKIKESYQKIESVSKDNIDEPLIIIVQTGNENLGLIVDSLLDEEDMVIKSLPAHMKGIQMVSGVTISGKNEIINVLHIPAVIEAAKEMREAKGVVAETKGVIHILVVDDSINTRDIEKSILESYGYKVDVAGDGIEAIEKTKEFKYDIVITDIEMPRLDGFSLTERLRKDETYRDTPIVIVTSREKEEDKRRGIAVGADAYIIKGSFDQSNLLETVQNLVG